MEEIEASDNRAMTAEEEETTKLSKEEDERKRKWREKRKKRLLKETEEANKKGVCYLSRVPPKMDPLKLHQILSQYGEIQRIYLSPEDPAAQVKRKRAGGFRGQEFSAGWVEFANKRIAKRVANMLNGEQIGGRKRSQFYYDLWNIKYLSKFKWDDLTGETAYRTAIMEQKLAMETSAAKKERDFYLSQVERSRAWNSIEERLKKKQKVQQGPGMNYEHPMDEQGPKVIRQFPQTQPVSEKETRSKPNISKDLLAEVFNTSSR
ncbi:hypothetical protein Nepgr_008643 [Nepenthes gracilis]|uniref:RRM domain-containing protein n=1 Tax=Nepenthes gracilis TaxID=150966 RepID=A0AAD3S9A8_NEPGR|nr:hypothetical protein Nepgr_008643 [Nepenthes gracilis]